MNLRTIDLNLLVVLDALLDEAHVSRAANRVGLSQPATSAALQRCRDLFSDDLLERGRGNMRLTAKAESLRLPLKALLDGVGDLVDPAQTPLMDLVQTIRITTADYPALFMIGPLQQHLEQTAPNIDLIIQPWHGADAARQSLVAAATDIAISVFPDGNDDIERIALFHETYVIAMRPGHPAAQNFGTDAWLDFPHVLVSGRGDTRTPLDDELNKSGRSRRVGLVVPTFQMVPDLLRASNMIAMLPSRIMPEAPDLLVFQPPIPVTGFPLHLAWHRRRNKDQGLKHVIALLTEILR